MRFLSVTVIYTFEEDVHHSDRSAVIPSRRAPDYLLGSACTHVSWGGVHPGSLTRESLHLQDLLLPATEQPRDAVVTQDDPTGCSLQDSGECWKEELSYTGMCAFQTCWLGTMVGVPTLSLPELPRSPPHFPIQFQPP